MIAQEMAGLFVHSSFEPWCREPQTPVIPFWKKLLGMESVMFLIPFNLPGESVGFEERRNIMRLLAVSVSTLLDESFGTSLKHLGAIISAKQYHQNFDSSLEINTAASNKFVFGGSPLTSEPSLITWLHLTRPRDKIYSVLGLANYQKHEHRVECSHRHQDILPTWISDWRYELGGDALLNNHPSVPPEHQFDSSSTVPAVVTLNHSLTVMNVQGIYGMKSNQCNIVDIGQIRPNSLFSRNYATDF